ncbi:DUF2922 domain-containing protein [Chryseomicrobium palamuruense]|uniref:DUF2922 domain-containing protein n=1 Tax=Chryseomicrobium palamuruense TaxID=682973 RepID=A0ABV8UY28_9BACL
MAKTLQLEFANAAGKTMLLSVDEPTETLTGVEVTQAMNAIIASSLFFVDGSPVTTIHGAQIVERQVQELI